jgi:hypothetical protein
MRLLQFRGVLTMVATQPNLPGIFPGSKETQEGTVAAEKQAGPLDADKLRELASWYREFADRAGDRIRQARLRIAEDLEHEADLLSHVRQG